MFIKDISRFGSIALVAVMASGSAAMAAPERDAVVDARGLPVLSKDEKCVRTMWKGDEDICAPKVEPAPEPEPVVYVPPPAPKVTLEEMKEARTVYFDFNKATISEADQHELNAVVALLQTSKKVSGVRVVGYADRIGSVADNEALSQRRAKAVEAYLHSLDYTKTSVSETQWLGESVPATECPEGMNRTALIECLSKDRRVEVKVDYVKEVLKP